MNRIKCIRIVKGYSQAKFGEIFNVDQTAVSNWENEKNNIDVKIIEKISEYFDLPMDFVCGREIILQRPISEWYPDEIEDYEKAPEIIKDYILYKFGRGIFANHENPVNADSTQQLDFSDEEIQIMLAYRAKPDMQAAVCTLLGITQKMPSANIAEDVKKEAANFTAPSRQTINTK